MRFLQLLFSKNPDAIIKHDLSKIDSEIEGDDKDDVLIPDIASQDATDEKLGFAEGQTFGIEYVNAKGEFSSRLITVFNIVDGPTAPILRARCQTSKRTKSFRIDRIESIYDLDGEVFETRAFLIEAFGMHSDYAKHANGDDDTAEKATTSPSKPERNRWNQILSLIQHPSVLLSALALSDGIMCEEEIDAAVRYLNDICCRQELDLDDEEIFKLQAYFSRLRPSEKNIIDSLESIYKTDIEYKNKFINTCKNLIAADDVIHKQEQDLFNEFSHELTGLNLITELSEYRINNSDMATVFGAKTIPA